MSHVGVMPMTLACAIALAEARSCFAALADGATDFDESICFEQPVARTRCTMTKGPALDPMTGSRGELLQRLEAAVEELIG